MPRRKQHRPPDRTYVFNGCRLLVSKGRDGGSNVRWELKAAEGCRLASVPLLDRELAADALRGWLGPNDTEAERIRWHEDAYARLWGDVAKGWEDKAEKEAAPCPS